MKFDYMTILAFVGAAALVGAFIEEGSRKQRKHMEELERKIDRALELLAGMSSRS